MTKKQAKAKWFKALATQKKAFDKWYAAKKELDAKMEAVHEAHLVYLGIDEEE